MLISIRLQVPNLSNNLPTLYKVKRLNSDVFDAERARGIAATSSELDQRYFVVMV
jgi:hypothetical protein